MDNVNTDVTTPCKDVAEAIDRLYRSLPSEMSLGARCRRHAVFLSMAESKGVTYELALLQLTAMKEGMLSKLHEEIHPADLAFRYISTIDLY